MQLLEVLIEYAQSSLNRPFSYVYKGEKNIQKGTRVLITFNNHDIVGYVITVTESNKTIIQLSEELGFELQEIKQLIDESPLLNEELFSLLDESFFFYILLPRIVFFKAMSPLHCLQEGRF